MRYFLIAGEPSGDMHAATLMAEIKNNDTEAEFQFFGGDLMQAQGGVLLKHYSEMAFMGIIPVILNLRTIKRNFAACEAHLLSFQPDVLILIDYPGFNLRMAKFAKQHNIPTSYYISPKIWAWKTKRVENVKAYVDQMYTIFPFETAFYKKYDYRVTYVGNPVWDVIQKELKNPVNFNLFCATNKLNNKPIVALLAGSRKQEITSLLPIMKDVAHLFPEYQFVVAGAPGNTVEFYQKILKKDLPLIFDQTHTLLRHSQAAVVASGTATLETALLNIPQVVIYKMGMGWILELFRKQFLKIEFFSLVNLVAEKEIVKELFQSQVTAQNIKDEMHSILSAEPYRLSILKGYQCIQDEIQSDGAAVKAAKAIVKSINKQN